MPDSGGVIVSIEEVSCIRTRTQETDARAGN